MKHRGPILFAAVWLLVLIVPPLRRQPWRQVVPNVAALFQADSGTSSPDYLRQPVYSGPDGRLQFAVDTAKAEKGSKAMAALVLLVQQHPGVVWLKADTLRHACESILFNTDNQDATLPRLSLAMKKQFAHIAANGALQEPNNAFFPLMQALFLMSSGQNQSGLLALQRARRCVGFDDYLRAGVNRRLAMIQSSRPVSWERRLSESLYSPSPHLASYFSLGKYLLALGQAAERTGNTTLAWHWYEAALTVGRVMQKSADSIFRGDMGQIIEDDVWRGATHAGTRPTTRVELADNYAALITKWGAPAAIAKESIKEAPNSLDDRVLHIFGIPYLGLVSPATVRIVSQAPWLAAWLASLSWIGAALWYLCGLVSSAWRQSAPPRATRWSSWFACGGLFCLFSLSWEHGVGTAWSGVQELRTPLGYASVLQPLLFFAVLFFWGLGPLVWWLLGIEGWRQKQRRDLMVAPRAGVTVPLLSLLQCFLWAAGVLLSSTALWALASGIAFLDAFWIAGPVMGASLALSIVLLARKTWQVRNKSLTVVSAGMLRGIQALAQLGKVSGRIALGCTVAYLVLVLCLWATNHRMDGVAKEVSARGQVAVVLRGL